MDSVVSHEESNDCLLVRVNVWRWATMIIERLRKLRNPAFPKEYETELRKNIPEPFVFLKRYNRYGLCIAVILENGKGAAREVQCCYDGAQHYDEPWEAALLIKNELYPEQED
jgi:hypothetical protein